MNERWFDYAYIGDIEDWLRLGWLPHDSLGDCTHGRYRVLVEWVCCCDRAMPIRTK